MAKNKSSEMPHYELLYIISNKFSENEVLPIKETVEKLITDNQGIITFKQDWGKKKLAYPIKHFRHGYYQLLEFDMPSESTKIVDNNLRLSDQILRHQIVTKDVNAPQAGLAEVTAAKEAAEVKEVKEVKTPTKTKPEPVVTPSPKPEAPAPIKPAEKKADDDGKVDMKDLDDKLDKILDSESFF